MRFLGRNENILQSKPISITELEWLLEKNKKHHLSHIESLNSKPERERFRTSSKELLSHYLRFRIDKLKPGNLSNIKDKEQAFVSYLIAIHFRSNPDLTESIKHIFRNEFTFIPILLGAGSLTYALGGFIHYFARGSFYVDKKPFVTALFIMSSLYIEKILQGLRAVRYLWLLRKIEKIPEDTLKMMKDNLTPLPAD